MGVLDAPAITRTTGDARYSKRLRALLTQAATLPAVTSDTPTVGAAVTVGAAAVTATTGSALTAPIMYPLYRSGVFANGINTDRFRVTGWSLTNTNNHGIAANPGGYTGGGYPAAVEFVHYGAGFDLRVIPQGSAIAYQIYVNGQPASATQLTSSSSQGAASVFPVTFGSRALRTIRVVFSRSLAFGGVIIAGTDFLASSGRQFGPQMLVLGDSYADGANGVATLDTYAVKLGAYLGVDMWVDGQGGTGFVATGGAGKSKYLDRVTGLSSESRLDPWLVFLQGSTNDGNGNEGSVSSSAAAVLAAVRSQWPNAKVVVSGLMYPRGVLGTGMGTANSNLRTTATGASGADLFIDPISEVWFSGNSTSTSTNGSGNSDFFMSSDAVHGTQTFHDVMAMVLARRISEFVVGL